MYLGMWKGVKCRVVARVMSVEYRMLKRQLTAASKELATA